MYHIELYKVDCLLGGNEMNQSIEHEHKFHSRVKRSDFSAEQCVCMLQ